MTSAKDAVRASVSVEDPLSQSQTFSSRWLLLYLMALTFACALWNGEAGRVAMMGVFLVGAVVYAFPYNLERNEIRVPPIRRSDVLATIAIALIPALLLVRTWSEEFPYFGDHGLHLSMTIEALSFWKFWLIPTIPLVAYATYRTIARRGDSIAPLVVIGLLAAKSTVSINSIGFAYRYSALFYFVAAPFEAGLTRLGAEPLAALRLINVAAIPGWLLVLRRQFLGRSVDAPALLISAFLLVQWNAVQLFTSAYLEPWAVVLILLAAEYVLIHGSADLWRPLLLLGTAAMVKDNTILAFSGFGLVALLDTKRRAANIATSIVAVTPFLAFYAAHRDFDNFRRFTVLPFRTLLDKERAVAFFQRVASDFGWAFAVLVVLTIATIVLGVFPSKWRRYFLAFTISAIANIATFYVSNYLIPWTGYYRLNFIAVLLVAMPLFLLGERLRESRVTTMLVTLLLVALNTPGLRTIVRETNEPDYARNFSEHTDAPIFLPIRATARAATAAGILTPGSRVRILHDLKAIYWHGYLNLEQSYPDLTRNNQVRSRDFHWYSVKECACSGDEMTMAVFIYFPPGRQTLLRTESAIAEQEACARSLERSCARRLTLTYGGQVIAAAGRGERVEQKQKGEPKLALSSIGQLLATARRRDH